MRKKKQLTSAQQAAQLEKLDAQAEKSGGFVAELGGMLMDSARRRDARQAQLKAFLNSPEALAKRREIWAAKGMLAAPPPHPPTDEKTPL
jgi:hypothetical protein